MTNSSEHDIARRGRQAALMIAGTGVFWILSTFIGGRMGLSNRTLALFDLVALAGFIWAFWMIFQIWRLRQDNQG
jgi:threonine/homoserine/homoserine lactone efflux protein